MCTFDLKYNDYNANISDGLQSLLATSDISDVTLAVEGKFFKAHQVILSIFSPYFRELFCVNVSSKNMIFFMKNVKHRIMGNILSFMYEGSVQIPAEDIQLFVDTANELKIRGLTSEYQRAVSNILPATTPIESRTGVELDDSTTHDNDNILNRKPVKRETELDISEAELTTKRRRSRQSFEEHESVDYTESNEPMYHQCESTATDDLEVKTAESKFLPKMVLADLQGVGKNEMHSHLKSTRGQPLYADKQHHIYTLQRIAADGSTWHWACEKKGQKPPCGGRIWTKGADGPVLKIVKEHNHAAQTGRLESLQILEQIRQHAASTDALPNDIIAATVSQLPSTVAASLPNMDSIKRTIRLARKS